MIVASLLDGLGGILKKAMTAVLDWFTGQGEAVINTALAGFSMVGGTDLGVLVGYQNAINYMFPLVELVSFTVLFLQLWTAVKVIRIIVKLIPTIG